ncbi:FAD-dependent oxidoreductase [Marinobacter sp. TBZ242]|uniref:FAD-dependent oxidoreductase n=1 Tax=Marinobacter azerbaijanicus TaxID=3050455 RepID=A0ABT7IL54_9GAMM|nr:FAD-dependent oxidoreductase [Marinobacter sp. TBZ242]MDL0433878.1 FAD-dependent oxidoreductase [Marinobacter sp. TBZ242]
MKVAVIGLGAVGAQVLWQLSRHKHLEVQGFDTAYPGHSMAGAGGGSRLFWNLEFAELAYTPLIRRAETAWRELESVSSRVLRDRTGVLVYGEEGDAQLECAMQSAGLVGSPIEMLGVAELRKRFPQFLFPERSLGLWDQEGAVIRPERTVAVAGELARHNGATIHEFTPVHSIEPSGTRVKLTSPQGVQTFDQVVVACGGWTTKLLPHIRDEVVVRRLTSMWFNGNEDGYLTHFPPFLRTAPSYCYGIPSHDSRTVKLGLGFNDHYVTGDADRLPRHLTGNPLERQLDKFEWIRQEMLPGLARRPYRVETYVESYTRTMIEYIRRHPESDNILIMTGFSGHGFRVAPVLGEIGCQIVLEGESDIDIGFMGRVEPVFSILDREQGTTTHNAVMKSRGSKN